MKAKDSTETADDRQRFVVFPSEVDDLFRFLKKCPWDAPSKAHLLLNYLCIRRKGDDHGLALSKAKVGAHDFLLRRGGIADV